jgi:hypothetical protein
MRMGEQSPKIFPERTPKSQSANSAIGFNGRLQHTHLTGLVALWERLKTAGLMELPDNYVDKTPLSPDRRKILAPTSYGKSPKGARSVPHRWAIAGRSALAQAPRHSVPDARPVAYQVNFWKVPAMESFANANAPISRRSAGPWRRCQLP